MKRQHAMGTTVTLVTALVLAGCGTTSDPVINGSTGEGSVTLEAADGSSVVLDAGPAQRVVSLEWEYAEILNSLDAGGAVVGLSDIKGYETYVGPTVPLGGDPQDVGERLEPSVEAIADLEPDLILASDRSIPDTVRDQMERIAPVLVLTLSDESDPLGQVKKTTRTLATAVGDPDAAEILSADLDAALEENAAEIDEAGLAGAHAVFAYVFTEGSTVSIRMHVPGSEASAVLTALGLEPAWEDDKADGGLTYLDVEGLTQIPDDSWFLYWDDAEDPIEGDLSDNDLWNSLRFVEDGHVAGTSRGVWMYGGPESMIEFANQATAAVTDS